MKKASCFILVAVLAVSLFGCAKSLETPQGIDESPSISFSAGETEEKDAEKDNIAAENETADGDTSSFSASGENSGSQSNNNSQSSGNSGSNSNPPSSSSPPPATSNPPTQPSTPPATNPPTTPTPPVTPPPTPSFNGNSVASSANSSISGFMTLLSDVSGVGYFDYTVESGCSESKAASDLVSLMQNEKSYGMNYGLVTYIGNNTFRCYRAAG